MRAQCRRSGRALQWRVSAVISPYIIYTRTAATGRRSWYTFLMIRLRNLLLVPFILISTFFLASFAHAQSNTQLQTELNALLQQLATLQAQLQATGAPSSIPAINGAYGQCPALFRTVRAGMSGSDVTGLQVFLAADTRVYPEGTISGYFGALTERAIRAFQARHGIVSSGSPETTGYGSVGPATRAAIAGLCRNGNVTQVPVPPPTQTDTCSLGGRTVAQSLTADFYSVAVAPEGSTCATYRLTRQCINGSFSGNASFQYPSCTEAVSLNCRVDGELIGNGVSLVAFSKRSVNVGEVCSSYAQTRTCTNGMMSGSSNFTYLSCRVDVADSCSLGGVTVAHGASRTFYKFDTATSTNSCGGFSQTRTCNDGSLSGSNEYSKTSCAAGACVLDGATFANGSSTAFYFAQNIPASEKCSSYAQTRTCSNGTFSGAVAYKYRTCAPVTSGTCTLDNTLVANGASATFYSTSTAAIGTSCASALQNRTCTNGALSGTASFNRASCTDTAVCTLDDVSVSHGNSSTFYSARTVNFGSTCSGISQTRICTNGKLSGGVTFKYGACSVNPPVSSIQDSAQLAAALSALEALLKDALVKLNSWF